MIDSLALPTGLAVRDSTILIRRATPADLRSLLRLLGDDEVSASRGDAADESDAPQLELALRAILDDPSNDLVVAVDHEDAPVGMLQLTRIPGLSRRGSTRLLVEGVRVDRRLRSAGIGTGMMRWVMDSAAPATGAALVQLTSDARRDDAHRFYRGLGFDDSHVGFKWKAVQGS
ncbi:GNAT family N-acetyltransferase [Demequina sp. NBRC 110054]|uniref:GNAT family N-acetyltransferase n=1 Tax=Demequina sp. NBRC 110054 TaxID=1570343 RepID=UPI000A00831E|nr:GNAT family N-acetyltransferase [Demequina sp. NBRC 110054]